MIKQKKKTFKAEHPESPTVAEEHLQDLEYQKQKSAPPSHYAGKVQPIALLEAQRSKEEVIGFDVGNVIKYMARLGKKGDALSDAKKAQYYVNHLVKLLKAEEASHEKNETDGEAQA